MDLQQTMFELNNPTFFQKTASTFKKMFIFLILWLVLVAIETIDYHFSVAGPPSREREEWVVSL